MTLRSWVVLVALSVIWGMPYFFIKVAVAEIPPTVVAWARIALGAVILVPVAQRRGALKPAASRWRPIFAFALAELIIPFPLISLGERWISSTLTALLIATLPFFVIALGPLFGVSDRLTRKRVLGLAAGFAGVVVLLGVEPVHGPLGWAGVACILTATLGYAFGSLTVQRYLHGVDEFGSVALSLAVASVALLPLAALSWSSHLPSMQALGSVVLLGIVCTAAGLWLYFYLIAQTGAARGTVFTYVNPVVATLLGTMLLDEPFTMNVLFGIVLILVGSWLATDRT